MHLPPLPTALRSLPVRVLNHLLADDGTARGKLALHGGKIARVDFGSHALNIEIGSDGYVSVAEEAPAAVVIRVKPADLPLMLYRRDRAASYVRVEGDAELAHALSQLADSLRWDAEADLARWIGDIAAVRTVAAVRGAADSLRDAGSSVAQSAAEYLTEENPVLARPADIEQFGAQVRRLRDDVERLAKRADGLNRGGS